MSKGPGCTPILSAHIIGAAVKSGTDAGVASVHHGNLLHARVLVAGGQLKFQRVEEQLVPAHRADHAGARGVELLVVAVVDVGFHVHLAVPHRAARVAHVAHQPG